MPQLDVTTFSSQLFWLALSFAILYLILSRIALPKVAQIYEGRQATIGEKLSQASRYQEQAEELLTAYEAKLASARIEAHARYQSGVASVTTELARKQRHFHEALQARLRLEEHALHQEALGVRKDIQKASLDVAAALLKKLTSHAYAPKDLTSFREDS